MNGFIMPNILWDIKNLNIYQRGVLTHIVRKTVGWNKKKDGISLSQFVDALNISRPKVISTLAELEGMNLIGKEKVVIDNRNSYNLYWISDHVTELANRDSNNTNPPQEQSQPPKQPTEQKEKPKDKLTQFRDLIMNNMKEMKILSIGKSKVNNTDDTKVNFKAISNEAIFNMEQLAKEYVEYVNRNRGRAVRLDKWLLAYMERNLNDIEYVNGFCSTSSIQNTQGNAQSLKPLAVEYLNGTIEEYETGKDLTWIVDKNGMANLESRYHVVGKPKLNEELKRRGVA